MRYVKMLGLAAVSALALTALLGAGSASATVLCSVYKVPCPKGAALKSGTAIELSLRKGASLAVTDIAKNLIATCTESVMNGKTTNTGKKEEAVTGNVEGLTFGKCTAAFKVLKLGTFEVTYKGPNTRGEFVSVGGEVTVNDMGLSCDYGTVGGVEMGIMESDETENPDFFEEEATMKKEEGGFLCPGSIIVKGIYEITAPAKVFFKEEEA